MARGQDATQLHVAATLVYDGESKRRQDRDDLVECTALGHRVEARTLGHVSRLVAGPDDRVDLALEGQVQAP